MKRIFLLKQHIGAPDTAAVAVGDEVKVGTLLAYPEKLGANIFSSVEGKVTVRLWLMGKKRRRIL